jgi:hypothetical protein
MGALVELKKHWDQHYSDSAPIAHLMRESHENRWVRFHALPRSKRYPETASELEVVLSRHNTLLSEIAAAGQRLHLITVGYSEDSNPTRDPDLEELDPRAEWWQSILMEDDGEGWKSYWHFYASERAWEPGVFDPLLRLVADDRIANVLIADADHARLYHPYDGGADIILEKEDERDRLKRQFKDWRSRRSDGL